MYSLAPHLIFYSAFGQQMPLEFAIQSNGFDVSLNHLICESRCN